MGDMIRDLFVRLGVWIPPKTVPDIDKLDREIERVKRNMEDAASGALRMGLAIATLAAGAVIGLGKIATSTGEHSIEVERQAKLLNLSRKEYQEWLFVTQRLGGTQRDLADSFLQINEAAQRAVNGSKEMTETFGLIGIGVDQLKGKNASELFDLLATQIAKTTDRGKAMAVVSRLLGEESARKLGPALQMGAEGVRSLRQEAHLLGLVMTDEQLAASVAVGVSWQRLKGIVKGLRLELGAALAPVFDRIIRRMNEWVKVNREWISLKIDRFVELVSSSIRALEAAVRALGGWDTVLSNLAFGAGMLGLLANFSRIQAMVEAIGVSLKLLRAGFVAAGAVFGAAFAPAIIIAAGVAGALFLVYLMIDDVVTYLRGGESVLGGWLTIADSILPVFGAWRAVWWSIGKAIAGAFMETGRFIKAIVLGLSPALQLINAVLMPIVNAFRELFGYWQALNAMAMRPMQWVSSQLDSMTAARANNSQIAAGQLQNSVLGSVQSQIGPKLLSPEMREFAATLNQNNPITFNGFGQSEGDVTRAIESQNRKAAEGFRGFRW
jgi:hypothetical protein